LDARAVAAPIFGLENRLLGTLCIAGPIHRFTPETLPGKIRLVMSAAAEFTWKLGGFPSSSSKGNQSLKCYLKTYAFNCSETSTE